MVIIVMLRSNMLSVINMLNVIQLRIFKHNVFMPVALLNVIMLSVFVLTSLSIF
jgi:hypothetical protein